MLAISASAMTQTLATGWQIQSSAKVTATGDVLSTPAADVGGWLKATVPSTVMGVLTMDGVEPEALTAADYRQETV